ncbi:MAG: hypothetical protein ACT4OX_17265, partial [Actinomycetota bacterium]
MALHAADRSCFVSSSLAPIIHCRLEFSGSWSWVSCEVLGGSARFVVRGCLVVAMPGSGCRGGRDDARHRCVPCSRVARVVQVIDATRLYAAINTAVLG